MQEIAPGVMVATEFRRITVGAVATGDGIVCIDVPPYPDDARAWKAALQERYVQPVRVVVVTDAHRDRLLGLHWFEGAQLIAHDAAFEAMRLLPNSFVEQAADTLATNSEERAGFAGVRLRMPWITFSERMVVYVNDYPVSLVSMPGPTPGNIWAHLPEQRVIFTGDSVVIGQHPYMAQVQSKKWLNSLSVLRRPRFPAQMIVPGRGPVTDKESTRAISDFLRYVRRRVYRLYRTGRPRADIANLVPGLLGQFPIPPGQNEEVQRRLKAGLERIYDEFRQDEDNH